MVWAFHLHSTSQIVRSIVRQNFRTNCSSTGMSDPSLPKTEKKKKLRSKQRSNEPACISYENPDIKVVLRLLPPTLLEKDFLLQLKALCPSAETDFPWSKFFFSQGSRIVQPFEEPKYSRAYFLFSTKDAADRFQVAMQGASFLEPESGDLFLAQTMKPIFGAVAEIPPASTIGEISSDPLFVKFMALRAAKAKDIDLVALVSEMRAAKRKSKKKLAADKKAKAKSRLPASKPDLTKTGVKADGAKPKRTRKRKKAKADGAVSDSRAVNTKAEPNNTGDAQKSAQKAAPEAGAGTPTDKLGKQKKKSKKKKSKKETVTGAENSNSNKIEPKAEKVLQKLSEPKADPTEAKKKTRSRKRKPKPKPTAVADTSS